MSFMKAHNFNWVRLWTTEMAQVSTSDDPYEKIIAPPFKWIRTGPEKADDGAPKDNFTQPDPKYFDRMRSRIIQAGQNGIYVSVMLFNGYMWQFDEMPADGNPFESGNNVNALVCSSGVCPSNNSEIPAVAWSYEQAYLQKVVDTVNDWPAAVTRLPPTPLPGSRAATVAPSDGWAPAKSIRTPCPASLDPAAFDGPIIEPGEVCQSVVLPPVGITGTIVPGFQLTKHGHGGGTSQGPFQFFEGGHLLAGVSAHFQG
jgi:hypothetical protein